MERASKNFIFKFECKLVTRVHDNPPLGVGANLLNVFLTFNCMYLAL